MIDPTQPRDTSTSTDTSRQPGKEPTLPTRDARPLGSSAAPAGDASAARTDGQHNDASAAPASRLGLPSSGQISQAAECASRYVQDQPWRAIGMTALGAFVLGMIFSRRGH